MGVKGILAAVRSPLMNAHCERVIVNLRRGCFDHVIVWSEAHARRLLASYVSYFYKDLTRLALNRHTPDGRSMKSAKRGEVVALPRVGGLHHRLHATSCLSRRRAVEASRLQQESSVLRARSAPNLQCLGLPVSNDALPRRVEGRLVILGFRSHTDHLCRSRGFG